MSIAWIIKKKKKNEITSKTGSRFDLTNVC